MWKPPFRATIVLQMLGFTHGYGVLKEQNSQENKKKLKLSRRNSYEKKVHFPSLLNNLTISKEGLSVSMR